MDFFFFLFELLGPADITQDPVFGGGRLLFHFMAMQGHEYLMRYMLAKFPQLSLFQKD